MRRICLLRTQKEFSRDVRVAVQDPKEGQFRLPGSVLVDEEIGVDHDDADIGTEFLAGRSRTRKLHKAQKGLPNLATKFLGNHGAGFMVEIGEDADDIFFGVASNNEARHEDRSESR